jgi:uncharacterized RDD family membrane protein YckC
MRCRYCGAENPEAELRCHRCQRRLLLAQARPGPETYPVLETATAPQLATQPQPRPAGPQLHAVNEHRPAGYHPVQQSLFAHGANERVVMFDGFQEPGRAGKTGRTGARRRRPVPAGQGSLDFSPPPPPRKPGLFCEMDSSKAPLPVAPLALRAASSLLDCMVVLAFTGVFLLTLQAMSYFALHQSLFVRPAMPYLLAAPALFGFLYKLVFAVCGGSTVGVRLMGLTLVSFDGDRPNSAQRLMRMIGGWVSLCAAAIGLVWALADQETLTWHDHMSGTFLTAAHSHTV